jgi:hypothetical protein
MKLPPLQRGQQLRELPRRSCDGNPFVGDAFGEMEQADAEVEHRGASSLEIEPPCIDFPEMNDQLSLKGVIAPDQVMQLSQEPIVGKALQRRHGR